MSNPSSIIRKLIIEQNLGVASTGAWPVFVAFMPNTPDSSISVQDTAGLQDGRLMIDGTQIIHPGIQVRIRGPIYPDVWNKAEAIGLMFDRQKDILVELTPTDKYRVFNISRQGDIIPMGIEEEGDRRRHNLTVNAILTIRKED